MESTGKKQRTGLSASEERIQQLEAQVAALQSQLDEKQDELDEKQVELEGEKDFVGTLKNCLIEQLDDSQESDRVWTLIPDRLKADTSFAREVSALRCKTRTGYPLAFYVLRDCPGIFHVREVWKNVTRSKFDVPQDDTGVQDDDFYVLFVEQAPPSIRQDREIMLGACTQCPRLLEEATHAFKDDFNFL